LLIPNRLELT